MFCPPAFGPRGAGALGEDPCARPQASPSHPNSGSLSRAPVEAVLPDSGKNADRDEPAAVSPVRRFALPRPACAIMRFPLPSFRTRTSLLVVLCTVPLAAVTQRYFTGGWGESYIPDETRTPREVPTHSTGTPNWTNPPSFERDVFTFARIKRERVPFSHGGPWTIDAPDADLNLSYRLQQMTSMRVDPNGRFVWLTDEDLSAFPFIYMVEPGSLKLSEMEVTALRKYLLNGGFLMLDDFWGEEEWAHMAGELKKVFPEREFTELPLTHPLYHSVFPITAKGQVPNVGLGTASEYTGVTWERADAKEVHHRVIFDDRGRIMVFAAHNTDNGDGWEREGEHEYFFKTYSEKVAYPLAINLIFYIMTH